MKIKDALPVCAECKYIEMFRCNATAQNIYRGGPRAECMCTHPAAYSTFQRVCPKSPRMPGFIGYTKLGGCRPTLKTSPKWCPLRKDNQCEAKMDEVTKDET